LDKQNSYQRKKKMPTKYYFWDPGYWFN
jgi:hypothetical protein